MSTEYACASNNLACRARVDDATKPLQSALDRLKQIYDNEHMELCRLRTTIEKLEKERDEARGFAVSHSREISRILNRKPYMPRWVSCSEKLPPFGDIVLLHTNEAVGTGWLERIDKGGQLWFQFEVVGISIVHVDYKAFRTAFGVTHWSPLPEPPSKDKAP